MSNELVHAATAAGTLPEKMEYARALAASGMLPNAYRQQPANVLVAIEYGEALGIKPIVAINEINVISGTPSPSASLMASLARDAGHRLRAWNEDDGSAVCTIVRADDPEFTHRARWDEAKARKAGLWGKGHWAKDPETMLRWRAISECVRLACPEVLGGLKYTPDEAHEIAGEYAAPRRVESEVVAPATTSAAVSGPAPEIPADLGDRIDASTDAEWLAKTADYLGRRFGESRPDEVAALQERISVRLEATAAPEAPESADAADDVDQAEQTFIDGELVDQEVAS